MHINNSYTNGINNVFAFGNVKISGAGSSRKVSIDKIDPQKDWFQKKWAAEINYTIDRAFGNPLGTASAAQKSISARLKAIAAEASKNYKYEEQPIMRSIGYDHSFDDGAARMSSQRGVAPSEPQMRDSIGGLLESSIGYTDYVEYTKRNYRYSKIPSEPLGYTYEEVKTRRDEFAAAAKAEDARKAAEPKAFQYAAMVDCDVVAEAAPKAGKSEQTQFEKLNGLSKAEAFAYIQNSGQIEKKLSHLYTSNGNVDIERTIEGYAYHAAAYTTLKNELFAPGQGEITKAAFEETLDKSLDDVSSALAKDLAGYFSKGGTNVDAEALAGSIKSIMQERVSAYQTLFDEGKITTEYTTASAQSVMYGEVSKGTFASFESMKVETQFGEISYDDISKISDVIGEFENAIALKGYEFGTTDEEVGIRLGMAKLTANLMNDGSELYAAFAKSVDARINEEKRKAASADAQTRADTNYAAGYSYSALNLSKVDSYIAMFSNINKDNIAEDIKRIMKSISNDYIGRPINDASHIGYTIDPRSSRRNMPEEYHRDAVKLMLENRRYSISTAENYAMASWNEWLGTTRNVKNASKYMLSSEYNSVDVFV